MSYSNSGDIWKDFEKDMAVKLGIIKKADLQDEMELAEETLEENPDDLGSAEEAKDLLEEGIEEDELGVDELGPEEDALELGEDELDLGGEEMMADDAQLQELRRRYEIAKSQNNYALAEQLLRQYKSLSGQKTTSKQAGVSLYYHTLNTLYKLASTVEAAGMKNKDMTGLQIGAVLDSAAETLLGMAKSAGKKKGPGVPDGTGPYAGTKKCQMEDEEEDKKKKGKKKSKKKGKEKK